MANNPTDEARLRERTLECFDDDCDFSGEGMAHIHYKEMRIIQAHIKELREKVIELEEKARKWDEIEPVLPDTWCDCPLDINIKQVHERSCRYWECVDW